MNGDTLFQQALELFQKGDIEKAENMCLQNLDEFKTHADTLNLLGAIFFKRGSYEQALESIQEACLHNPEKAPHFCSNLALVHVTLGNISQATSVLNSAAETYLGRKNEHDALLTFERAAFLLRDHGKFDEAKRIYNRILQIDPQYVGAYNDLGLISQHENDLEGSIRYFKKALEIEPSSAFTYNNLAITYLMQRKLKEAATLFEKALELDPNFVEAHINLGSLHAEQSEFPLAEQHLRKAADLVPNYPGIHNNLGILLHSQGKLEEAITHYKKALELDPSMKQAEQNLTLATQDLTKNLGSSTTQM